MRAMRLACVLTCIGWGFAPSAAAAQDVGQRERLWQEDIDYLAEQLELRHPDLYHTVTPERFAEGLRRIRGQIASFIDAEIAVRLARLLTTVGDGHTLVPLLWDDSLDFGRLPVEFVRTADGLSVLAADTSLQELVGARVTRLGGLSVPRALDRLATIVSADNAWTAYTGVAEYAAAPEVLHALDIAATSDRVPLEVDVPGEGVREVVLERIPADSPVGWTYGAFDDMAPWLSRRDDPYWMEVVGDTVAYVQFNRADRDKETESLAEFGRRLLGTVRDGPVRRIVLDVRWNHGGSRWRARHLLNALVAAEYELGAERTARARTPASHLVTLIGPNTFSAATQFVVDLELHTNTAFVGLPTGGKPNGYGEVGRFRLPNSGFEIRHSVYYHQTTHARDTRPSVFPDRWLEWTGDDVVTGRDPIFAAAFDWRLPTSAADGLRERIDRDGVAPALRWLDTVLAGPAPEHAIDESAVNRLGYEFLGNERVEDAEAIFRWNLERHPWSANAHDSLADAFLALDDERQAERLLCQAFAIDPQFGRALERGLRCESSVPSPP